MIKTSIFALALFSLFLAAGCGDVNVGRGSSSAKSDAASASAQPVQAVPPPQPAQTYQSTRRSTTQPLPPGYGYVNEKDLAVVTVRQ